MLCAFQPCTLTLTCTAAHAGAPKLATTAMRATQAAVSALASQPDRAAYYLPGLASSACAVLMDSSARLPASCHTATCNLLQEVLVLTLNPKTLPSLPSHDSLTPTTSSPHPPLSSTAALAALLHATQAPAQPTSASRRQERDHHPGVAAKLQVEEPAEPFTTLRNAAWLRHTAQSLSTMLPAALRAASGRKAASVRAGAAHLVVEVLQRSAVALPQDLLQPLLRAALLMSGDASPAVSGPCMKFLHGTAVHPRCDASERLWAELTAMAEGAAQELNSGAAWREESLLTSARLLSAALTALPSFMPESPVASGPAALLDIVCKLCEFDLPSAALWLQGHGTHVVRDAAGSLHPSSTALVAGDSTSDEVRPGQAGSSEQSATDSGNRYESNREPQVAADASGSGGSRTWDRPASTRVASSSTEEDAVVSAAARALQELPAALQKPVSSSSASTDMPFGLKRMEQEETFRAVVSVAAAAGCMCARAAPAEAEAHADAAWRSAPAVAAVEHVRVEMEAITPRASRRLKDAGDVLSASPSQIGEHVSLSCSACWQGISNGTPDGM